MKTTTRLPRGALLSSDLIERRRGVAEDLRASVERGEITPEQSSRFLARIDAALLAEQLARHQR